MIKRPTLFAKGSTTHMAVPHCTSIDVVRWRVAIVEPSLKTPLQRCFMFDSGLFLCLFFSIKSLAVSLTEPLTQQSLSYGKVWLGVGIEACVLLFRCPHMQVILHFATDDRSACSLAASVPSSRVCS